MRPWPILTKWLLRIALVTMLGALVIVLMLYLNGAFTPKVGPGARSATAPAAPVTLVEAKFVDVPDVEQSPGTIRPLHETALASKVREPEKVIEVNVTAGQEVHKGDLLVKLDSSTWQNRKEMAEAKLKSAQALRDDAQKTYDRIKEVVKLGAATVTEADNAKYRFEAAQAEASAAGRALDEAVMNLGYTQILAPMDAVVIDKRADVGDTVAPGQILVSLYDQMQLIANVREGLIKRLKPGQTIGVYLEDLGAACEGTISEIVPQADPVTRTFQVKVVGPCHAGVRPGMYAKLLVPLGDKRVLVIPPEALVQVGQLTMVDVAGAQGPERRYVQRGATIHLLGTRYVQILSGLKPGEKVALSAPAEPDHAH